MKTQIVRFLVFGAGLSSLLMCAGCEEGKAQTDTPVFTAAAPLAAIIGDKPAAPDPTNAAPVGALESTNAVTSTNMAMPVARVVQSPTTPPGLNVSPGLQEIIKLAQAGVSEEVMLAYVINSTNIFSLGSDEIVYLNDLGVSPNVVTTLIQHDTAPETLARKQAAGAVKPLPPGVALTTPATNVYPPPAVMTPPAPLQPNLATDPVVPPPADGQTVNTAPAQQVTVNYFYDNLSPYGSWVDVPDYGRCWQPTVAVSNPSWRPYADNGCWLWSDAGWYWHSYYSWGWAPFHYGRWSSFPNRGWLWVPDTCWGPSWVSWRHTTYHSGWAPLPPSCHYVSGFGLYYNNSSVSVGFDFGLAASCYTYIPLNRFCERNPHHYYLSGTHAATVHKDSTVINNYIVGNNNTIINNGIGRERVAKVNRAEIPHVKIRQVPLPKDQSARAERIEKNGSTLLVSSPQLPKSAATASTASLTAADARAGFSAPGHKAVVTEERLRPGATGRPAAATATATAPVKPTPAAVTGRTGNIHPGTATADVPSARRTASSQPLPRSEAVRSTDPVSTTAPTASDARVVTTAPTKTVGSGVGRAAPTVPSPRNNAGVAKAPTTGYGTGGNPNYSRPPTTALPAPNTPVPQTTEVPRNYSAPPDRTYRVPASRAELSSRSVGRPAPSPAPSVAPSYTAPLVRSEAHRAPVPAYRAQPVQAPVSAPAPSRSAPVRTEAPARSTPPPAAPPASSGSTANGRTGRETGR